MANRERDVESASGGTVTMERVAVPRRDAKESAAYMRRYRAENPTANQRDALAAAARRAALTTLARHHPDEFARLFDEERVKRGLPRVRRKDQ